MAKKKKIGGGGTPKLKWHVTPAGGKGTWVIHGSIGTSQKGANAGITVKLLDPSSGKKGLVCSKKTNDQGEFDPFEIPEFSDPKKKFILDAVGADLDPYELELEGSGKKSRQKQEIPEIPDDLLQPKVAPVKKQTEPDYWANHYQLTKPASVSILLGRCLRAFPEAWKFLKNAWKQAD